MGRPVVHFEIGCRDRAKTVSFYRELLGWKIQEDGPAAMVNTQSPNGIPGHINALGHEPHNYVLVYAQVDDLDATVKDAERLGAKMMIPPTEVPGMGHFAWIRDPEGTLFGLWKPLS